jgi:hypothetical protein
MIRSDAQRLASLTNAMRSTGPITAAGKLASSRNAFKHGFTTYRVTGLSAENAAIHDEVHRAYTLQFQPEGILEVDLVRRIADESFRLRLIEAAMDDLETEGGQADGETDAPAGSDGSREEAFVAATAQPDFQRRFGLLLRYKAATERAFYRALATLKQTRKERLAEEEEQRKTQRPQSPEWPAGFVSRGRKFTGPDTGDFDETPPETGRD